MILADKKPPTPTEAAPPRKLWKPSRIIQATAAIERILQQHGLEPSSIRSVFRFIESGLPPEPPPDYGVPSTKHETPIDPPI